MSNILIQKLSPPKQDVMINSYSVPSNIPNYQQPLSLYGNKRETYDIDNVLVSFLKYILSKKTHFEEDKYNEDDNRDFIWFTSGKANTQQYKGQYIAIWDEQIVANGSNAVDVKRITKEKFCENIHPLLTYIPEDEITPP